MKNKVKNVLISSVCIIGALMLCHLFANCFIPMIRSMHGL